MLARILWPLILLAAVQTTGKIAGQQPLPSEAMVVGASYFQDADDEPVAAGDGANLEQEYGKIDIRLRELEDDFEIHSKDADKTAKSSADTAEQTASSLKELRENVESLNESVDGLKGTIPSLVHHRHKSPKMELFGRIHLDYWAFPKVEDGIQPLEGGDPQDRFILRRLRIGVQGELNDNMFYQYEGEFAGGVASQYRDAFLGFRHLPFFNTVIIGNHKRPYSLDQLNSSNHNVFMERPYSQDAFDEGNRRLGISSNGYSDDLKRNWRYGVWNLRQTQDSAGYVGDHYQPEFAARRAYTPWYDECSGGRGYFHFAVANSVAFPNGRGGLQNDSRFRSPPEAVTSARWLDTGRIDGANTQFLNGVETVFNYGPFQAVAEYQRSDIERTGPIGTDLTFHGGYFYVSYFLTGEHMPWDRQLGTLGRVVPFENFFRVRDCDCNVQGGKGAWQIAARYSYVDLNDLDIVGGDGEALTLGLNWHWNPFARMQFNYIIGDVKREPLGSGDYEIFGVRFMVDF